VGLGVWYIPFTKGKIFIVCFIPLHVQKYESCKSQICTHKFILKMVLKPFCGSLSVDALEDSSHFVC